MKKYSWIIFALLLVVLIGGASVLYNGLGGAYKPEQLATQQTTDNAETEPDNMIAPDFTVVDGEGNAVKLSDFFGKPIVLNFWASWCGPCKSEMPDFNEAYLEQGEEVQFLMINMTDGSRETVETAKSFVEESGYSFPVYYDVNYDAAITYGVNSLPTTYFIAADGSLVAYGMAAMSAATLQRGINMITE